MKESEIKRILGQRVKSYRQNAALNQADFGAIIGLEQNNLSNIENGKSFPHIKTLCTMIEKTNADPEFLLGFLRDDHQKYDSLDLAIFNLLIDLPKDTKKHFRDLLLSLRK